MNSQTLQKLVKLADHLDTNHFYNEANFLDQIIKEATEFVDITKEFLDELYANDSRMDNPDYRLAIEKMIAEQRRLSPEVITMCATHEDWYVRNNIAKNVITPVHILNKLIKDENYMVRKSAQQALNNLKNSLK